MLRIKVILTILALSGVLTAHAGNDAVGARAARAYAAGEWASAQALYTVAADAEPTSADAAAHMIVSAEMRADTTVAATALNRYMSTGSPLEPLLDDVEELCYNQGRANMYGGLLLRLTREVPYLRRPLALRLLKFYIFRANPEQTIEYATMLLRGQPGDPQYLNAMGKAYMMLGDIGRAVRCFADALTSDPDNREALLALGNYYGSLDDAATALPYLRRAEALAPSEYLEREIERLQNLQENE